MNQNLTLYPVPAIRLMTLSIMIRRNRSYKWPDAREKMWIVLSAAFPRFCVSRQRTFEQASPYTDIVRAKHAVNRTPESLGCRCSDFK